MRVSGTACVERSGGKAAGALALAASPVFALMALLTAHVGGEAMAMCPMAGASPLGGMAMMYLLMSLFHAAPWVRLVTRLGK